MKFNEGNYILAKFSLDASAVTELKRSLGAAQDLIRFLVTRT
jgi:ribosomal protein S6